MMALCWEKSADLLQQAFRLIINVVHHLFLQWE
jgi:hypothetical protein